MSNIETNELNNLKINKENDDCDFNPLNEDECDFESVNDDYDADYIDLEELKELFTTLINFGTACKMNKKEIMEKNIDKLLLIKLCKQVKKIFNNESSLLELAAGPIKVVGDIHGQFGDLIRIFEIAGCPSKVNYLFLGDYVDRGAHSIETITLLFAYKLKFPKTFYLLRGNHESNDINKMYGFYNECIQKYDDEIYEAFNDVFDYLPVAAVIEKKIFCCHGGISKELSSIYEINSKITRPTKIGYDGVLCDLTWADPDIYADSWRRSNKRFVSFVFGKAQLDKFLDNDGLEMLVRAHECTAGGYKMIWDRKCVTVFSAPDYCGENNAGGIMSIESDLTINFHIYKQR